MDPSQTDSGASHLLAAAGITALPVDVEAIAAHCGLPIQYRHDLPDKVAGFLYRGPYYAVVVINARHPGVRQRFTLAHEIGHWFHADGAVRFKGIHRTCSGEAERAADRFAAELLMPAPRVRREWARRGTVPALAQRFRVSRAAMRRRLQELGLHHEPGSP